VVTPQNKPDPSWDVGSAAGRRWYRGVGRGRVSLLVLPLVGFAVLGGVWWLAVAAFAIPEYELPWPGAVLSSFWHSSGYLALQSWITLVEVLEGFVLAVVVGSLIALAISVSPIVERTVYALLVGLNSVPKVAVAPLLVVWFGFGVLPKVALVFMTCFFPIVISIVSGLSATPAEFIDLARSLEAKPWKAYVKIRLPNALPQVFVGLKVAMTLAVIGAVVAEFGNGTTSGLGYAISAWSGQGMTAPAFAAIALLAVLAIALFYALVGLERLLVPWARTVNSVS